MVGQTISHYKIVEKLGGGGMGVVYKAQDLKLDRFVALKFLPQQFGADEEERKRFEHEAKAASALDHNNICTIYEIGESEEDQMFIVMAYYEGETLKKKIEHGPLPIDQAMDIALHVAQGLSRAHEAGIIHRDIKPANIMVTNRGEVKIVDFGLAKLGGQTILTKTGTTLGTVAYMSPEQARGESVDARTDVWSLGIVLYEMITGQRPFRGEYDQAVIYGILNEEPAPLPAAGHTPLALERIVSKSLAKDREARYQGAGEMAVDLMQLAESGRSTNLSSHRMNMPTRRKLPVRAALGVIVLLAALAAVLWIFRPFRAAAVDSIAVMPFSTTESDPDLVYLTDGITERVISRLSSLHTVRKVIALSSVMQYKGKEIVPKNVGRELGVDALVVSRLNKRGDQVSILVELVKTDDGSHIWGDQFQRHVSEIASLQNDIARGIMDNLHLKLTTEEYSALEKTLTSNPEAYNLYLRGRYLYNKRSEEALTASLGCYKKAVTLDPQFSLACAGMADSYLAIGWYSMQPRREMHDSAMAAAVEAVRMGSGVAEAHLALGNVLSDGRNWKAAEEEIRKGLTLSPSDAELHHQYAHLLTYKGNFTEGYQEMKTALELEPLSVPINCCMGENLVLEGRYDAADEQLRKVMEMDPEYGEPHGWLGIMYVQTGKLDEAIRMFRLGEAFPRFKTRMIGALGYAFAVQGKRDSAMEQLARLRSIARHQEVEPAFIAWIYSGLGERDRVMEYLEKALAENSGWLELLKVDPMLKGMRGDPLFAALLKKLNRGE
jgi:serine/threonine-protein kinase